MFRATIDGRACGTLAFRRRVTIAYAVGARTVTVIGISYGGQDFESILGDD